MTSHNADTSVRIVRRIFRCISRSSLEQRIDRPLDKGKSNFGPCAKVETPADVIREVARLLCLVDPKLFWESNAGVEAVRLIEVAAPGGLDRNFHHFLNHTNGGLPALCCAVIDQLKKERRDHFVRGTLAYAIDPYDGECREHLAQALIRARPSAFYWTAMPVQKLANQLEDAFRAISDAESQINASLKL